METKHSTQTMKSILLLTGAFTFAFLLGEMVHDSGHYLCHMAYGNAKVQVHFDPFGGTHISGADGLPNKVLGITSAVGPLFNLTLGLASFFLLWRIRRPILLPLLLWGPLALIQEGVTFSLGLLTPGGDGEWISLLRVPQPIILMAGIILLIAGIAGLALFLPLAGIEVNDHPRYKLGVILVSMCSLMLIRSIYSTLIAPDSTMENLIPLVFSLLLAATIVLVHQPITKIADEITFAESPQVTWSASFISFTLGMTIFFFQVFALN